MHLKNLNNITDRSKINTNIKYETPLDLSKSLDYNFADLFRIWEMPSHHLEILCGNCRAFIIRYRKEGSGQLVRIYLDRITKPSSIAKLKSTSVKSDLPPLICPDCQNCMGLPMRHEGGRLAYRMIKGSFRKKEAK